MRYPKFAKAINEDIVQPALTKARALEFGTVTRSYYEQRTIVADQLQPSPVVLVDVAVTAGDGSVVARYTAVPVPRTFGVSPSLPPIGARVLLGFMPENRRQPLAIAVYDSVVTDGEISDNVAPKLPPGLLLR